MTTPHALRWGILAPGGIARTFTKDLQLNGFAVTAVGSRSLERSRAFAEEFGIERAHGSYEELVADPEVDVVYVASPHSLHAAQATLALEAGKHVLVEKAFTVTEDEARALVDLAAKRGLVVLEAMWTRYLPHMRRVREIIADATLGEIVAVTADHTQNITVGPEHRMMDPHLGGGALLDLGIYPISFVVDVLGLPDRLTATAQLTDTGVDAQVSAVFSYSSGAMATTFSSLRGAGPNQASIIGTDARIDIDRVWYTATSFRTTTTAGDVLEEFTSEVNGRGMHYQALELERLVAAGDLAGSILPPRESADIMGLLDEVRRQIGVVYPSEF
ncbi:Gfo/Idh/MocA family protein [Paramicrobacterium agarici]|uniref:Putative dehydrogenase n=1 Tax=Paramicrobacterium agarici TaxID=630514 RepID=A0A2A9DXV0_9MICO|nr:Gfo/Idh/MocA family oxidoreductase [Microbacterium agarici]PFG30749.1 putative dehydrogenase [Microbacterium agarici]TQO23752.1 putative dehydrogenase [Microbacterium agarici]